MHIWEGGVEHSCSQELPKCLHMHPRTCMCEALVDLCAAMHLWAEGHLTHSHLPQYVSPPSGDK